MSNCQHYKKSVKDILSCTQPKNLFILKTLQFNALTKLYKGFNRIPIPIQTLGLYF